MDEEVLRELEQLFGDVDTYFTEKEMNIKEKLNYSNKGYGQIKSRINTNLPLAKGLGAHAARYNISSNRRLGVDNDLYTDIPIS